MKKNVLLLLAPIFLVSVCGAWAAQPSPACHSGERAFKAHIHPLLRQNCVACHDAGEAGPPHSVADVKASYGSILPLVNFADVAQSKLVRKVKEKHWEPDTQLEITEKEFIKSISLWWSEGQQACESPGMIVTHSILLPPDLKVNESRVVQWSLDSLGSVFSGSYFQFEVVARGENENISYFMLWRPRLLSLNKAIHVEGVHIFRDGAEELGANNFSFIQATVNADSDSPLLSGSYGLLPASRQATRLSLGFDVLAESPHRNCHHVEMFTQSVLPIYRLRACHHCHAGGPENLPGIPNAKKSFPLDLASSEALCTSALQRVNGKILEAPPLISLPLQGAAGHPRVIPSGSEVVPAWTDWIENEINTINKIRRGEKI